MRVARASLHFWEEPPISGTSGSGAVFFAHCPLQCVFCQNADISHGEVGEDISEARLVDVLLKLQDSGAANINLVTATHYVRQASAAVRTARRQGLQLPVVWNSSGYETTQTLDAIADVVDVFLPDFKYWSSRLARDFSAAPDYPEVASAAVQRMMQLQPETVFDADGMIQRGVIVRHLVLPDHTRDSKRILRYLREKFGPDVWVSAMRQYTPPPIPTRFSELSRTVRDAEYDSVIQYAERIGLQNVFIQESSAAGRQFIPAFSSHIGDIR